MQKHKKKASIPNACMEIPKSTVASLHDVPRKCEHRLRARSGQSERYQQLNAIPGPTTYLSATPVLLSNALSIAKTAITRLQKTFFKTSIPEDISGRPFMRPLELLCQAPLLGSTCKKKHLRYAAKAAICEVLFEGFEEESFWISSSRSQDPYLLRAEFFQYYLSEQEQNHTLMDKDPVYKEFRQRKISALWESFHPEREKDGKSMKLGCLAALGSAELLLSFEAAAKSVWLLHKLAFSFEPPAFLFRVLAGDDFDPKYMDSVENIADCKRFVIPEVIFMITPGLRVWGTILRSEVFLV